MNELLNESSPYLLQHANNPVHWKAWNTRQLSEAQKTNKLIVVSIGYSACHWCHVMEHESFEDIAVAKLMNQHFISIKVDREERPDVDAIYMKAVQIMTKRGGWPLNCVCLPDGRPVWGGTYFRKNEWMEALEQLQELYEQEPDKMIEYAQKLHQGMEAISLVSFESSGKTDLKHIDTLVSKWQKSFDWEFGGYARAPKFMMPNNYSFLLEYGHLTQNQSVLDYVHLTLTKMAWGGVFDTVDGGFSRYSVDMKWHVPHFEKMLYDNAQLVSLYSDAYKLTQNSLYKTVIEKTLQFVEREWLAPFNGFYAALDADSINKTGQWEEGAFYTWTKEELQYILKDDFEMFSTVFNINDFGHWEKDNFVLIQKEAITTLASQLGLTTAALVEKKTIWEASLFTSRVNRNKPRLDDKCLTSWNALMLSGFLDAYKALQQESYLKIALKNAHFIEEKLWHPDGHLFHTFKNNTPSINGFLEDYSFTIQAFIHLYQATLNESWLQKAKSLLLYCLDHFYNEQTGFFKFTSRLDPQLIHVHYEIEDNVIPASNSVMAKNLLALSIYFENKAFENIALQMLDNILPNIDYPSAFSNWLSAGLQLTGFQKELAVCGNKAQVFCKNIQQHYFPHVVLAGSIHNSALPFLQHRYKTGATLLYVCQNKMCQTPVASVEEALKNLKVTA